MKIYYSNTIYRNKNLYFAEVNGDVLFFNLINSKIYFGMKAKMNNHTHYEFFEMPEGYRAQFKKKHNHVFRFEACDKIRNLEELNNIKKIIFPNKRKIS